MENILVDPLNEVSLDATLLPTIGDTIQETGVCELEPSEDSFLEFGRSSNEEPEQVSKWNAKDVLAASKVSETSPSSLQLVGQRKSCAWFELVVTDTAVDSGMNFAVPIALQIEVGDGSWESSLIQAETKGEEKDMVSFDLVIIWEKNSE